MNKLLLTIFVVTISFTAIAQEDEDFETSPLKRGTIENRFDYIMEVSNSYKGYKVVKIQWLEEMKEYVLDTLEARSKILKETKNDVALRNKEIERLNADLKTVNDSFIALNLEKDHIGFIGFTMKKVAYKNMMWIMIAGLLISLIFFIVQFTRSNSITLQTRQMLSEIRTEYEAYKNAAREKEQKLKRELQDELNKHP